MRGQTAKFSEQPEARRVAHQEADLPINAFPIFLTAKEAAKIRRQGLSSFWRSVKNGSIPQPLRVSERCPRWPITDILPVRE